MIVARDEGYEGLFDWLKETTTGLIKQAPSLVQSVAPIFYPSTKPPSFSVPYPAAYPPPKYAPRPTLIPGISNTILMAGGGVLALIIILLLKKR
jgi:hypothetical protein